MRCPYCGGLNPEQRKYCIRCGRNFPVTIPNITNTSTQQKPIQASQSVPPQGRQRVGYSPAQTQRPTVYPPAPPSREQSSNVQQQTRGTGQPVTPAVSRSGTPLSMATRTRTRRQPTEEDFLATTPGNLPAVGPTAPENFPPGTIAHLYSLQQGALPYQQADDIQYYARKKIVRIRYPYSAPWQQVATLMSAFTAFDDPTYDTIIIQGIRDQFHDPIYDYTNGQLIFDRNVRLGSQLQKRYQIETDNGFSNRAQRIVIAE